MPTFNFYFLLLVALSSMLTSLTSVVCTSRHYNNYPTHCYLLDGYNNPAANRTQFPLSSGFFSLNSEHPQWTGQYHPRTSWSPLMLSYIPAGVMVSSAANATSFNNFSQVKPFFQQQGEGAFCFPLNFSANANGTSLQDGQNVTIQVILLDFLHIGSFWRATRCQIMFNGGDGNLFQVYFLIYCR